MPKFDFLFSCEITPVKSITAIPSLLDTCGIDFDILFFFTIFIAEILLFFSLENIVIIPIIIDINIKAENIINFLSFLIFSFLFSSSLSNSNDI